MALLEMRGVEKRFGAVRALEGVDFDLEAGAVHALVGENGAGKSTLMKILAGVQRPSSGTMRLDGREVAFASVGEAQAAGIAMVYQELALVPGMSVAENLFLGRLPPWIDRSALSERARPVLAGVELDVDPAREVAELGVGERQLVEIAKAVAREGRVLILDEPTAALSAAEARRLFGIVGKLRAAGVAIVYISHRLEEVFEIADRVTVLRDGALVASRSAAEIDPEEIVRLMVGRDVQRYRRETSAKGAVLARLAFRGEGLEPDEIALREGEIVGLAGVIGSGRSRVLSALYGLEGEGALDGAPLRSPRDAIARGMPLVPGDRKAQGLALGRPVRENLVLAVLGRLQRAGFMDARAERAEAERWIRRLGLRPPDPEKPVGDLSGGNQQKVVVGRALATGPRLLLLEEPTRGVDVGARSEIYDAIDELAREGLGLVVSSSDTEELIGLCDRILVFRHGKVAAELHAPFTYEEVVRHVTGAHRLA